MKNKLRYNHYCFIEWWEQYLQVPFVRRIQKGKCFYVLMEIIWQCNDGKLIMMNSHQGYITTQSIEEIKTYWY